MKRLLLIGAGHAHAFVLEALAEKPEPSVEITVVSDSRYAAYSGSVPAWLAGECTLRETQIDIAALCQRAGARLITSPATSLSVETHHVVLASGDKLAFDIASLNIGSTLALPALRSHKAPYLLAMRPLSSLHERWQALQDRVAQLSAGREQRVVSVGSGAASCETLMSVLAQLRKKRADITWRGEILSASDTLLPGAGRLPRWLTKRTLRRANITVHNGVRGEALVEGGVLDTANRHFPADIALWATGAVGHAWLADTALPLDSLGFIQVEKTLEVKGVPGIFAAGDCAAFTPPLPNAGVYAVRMGPHLADNLRAACRCQPLDEWQPPKRVLALIGTGDGRAIASRGVVGFAGKWVWQWKKRIDARFIARFNPPFSNEID
ncbi:FAD-dependent oxidoreductase [Vreelandella salicampi]|uniref:FAD-dependent oxidoreductase n=1 Tax=Vreelandella salicampi TaxID=1449798 RepID=A0A7Z0LKD4_9GAMM|nr:FAD-dependent oxidoreductase [Halomonas salicampi]NYS60596.1 FAD-dependent oxidoreductase [Halomonas salicampi]